MFLSDLQSKDIVSIVTGKKIGRIIDAKIDEEGKITSLIVEPNKGMKFFFNSSNDTNISFLDIDKIGEDVILVKI